MCDWSCRLLKANITQLSGATSGVSAGLCSARANVALLIEEQRGFSASAEAIRQASACRSMDLMLELEEMRAEVRQGEVELSEAQQEIQTLRRLLEDVSSFLGPVAGKERLEPSSVLSELEKVLRSYRAVMAEKCTLEENNAGLVNKIVDMEQTLKSHGSEKAALENRQAELVSRVGELEESLADLKQREENLSYTAAEVEIMKAQVEDAQKARRDAVRALQSLNASQSIGGGLSPLPRRPCRSLGNPSEARHARAAWHGAASALLSRAESGEDTPQRLVIDMSASLIAAVAVMTQLEARLADCEAALAEADDLLADAEQEAAMSRAELQTIKV